MGSLAKAMITGFVCRLCSKMNRYVILIYGEEGIRMGLEQKINAYLPVTVSRDDPLPKTVCPTCVDSLEKHSKMVQFITSNEQAFQAEKEKLINKGEKKSERSTEVTNESEDSESDNDNNENERDRTHQ